MRESQHSDKKISLLTRGINNFDLSNKFFKTSETLVFGTVDRNYLKCISEDLAGKLVISADREVSLETIEEAIGSDKRVIRVNHHNSSDFTTFTKGTSATEDDANTVKDLFNPLGRVLEVSEEDLLKDFELPPMEVVDRLNFRDELLKNKELREPKDGDYSKAIEKWNEIRNSHVGFIGADNHTLQFI
jgi:hypothetical protein